MLGNAGPHSGTASERESGAAAVDKALDVLFHLHQAGNAGVTEVARALGMPKSTAHRLLTVLARRGLAERTLNSRYKPGFGLVALGYGLLDGDPVVTAARGPLEEAARELNETFFFVAARGGELIVLHKVEGTGILRAAPTVGASVPLHATAAGRLYLAFAPEEVVGAEDGVAGSEQEDPTCADAVTRARETGYALNEEGWIPGLSVLSAAVRSRGKMLGVVAVAAGSQRMAALGGVGMAPRLVAIAETISRRLEGQGEGS